MKIYDIRLISRSITFPAHTACKSYVISAGSRAAAVSAAIRAHERKFDARVVAVFRPTTARDFKKSAPNLKHPTQ